MNNLSRYYCGFTGFSFFFSYGILKKNIKIMVIGINCILYHIIFPINFYVCLYDIIYNLSVYLYFLIKYSSKINSFIVYLIYTIFIKWISRKSATKATELKHIIEVHFPGLLILMNLLY